VTGFGVRVAVIDSGWDHRLQVDGLPLEAGVSLNAQGVISSHVPEDHLGHGTACIGAIHRIAPGASITPIRIFDRTLETSATSLVAAIDWAVARGIHIVNLSVGTRRPDAALPLYEACARAQAQNVVIVASGEDGSGLPMPAAFDNVLSVGVGHYGDPFDFTYSTTDTLECRAACGVDGWARGLAGAPFEPLGSSFAAPNISGIVALLREHMPAASLDQVRLSLAGLSRSPDESAL
jgi:subtilisin family serine protease